MPTKNVVVLEKDENQDTLEVVVTIAPGWDDFEKLAQFLIREYGADVEKKYDGPDARRWILSVRGKTIELCHDDLYGNYIIAPKDEAEPLVREIALDLTNRLGGL